MVDVYIHERGERIRQMYFDVLTHKESFTRVRDFLEACVDASFINYTSGNEEFTTEFNNYNPKYIGMSSPEIVDSKPDIQDFRTTIANAYTFRSWDEVVSCDAQFDTLFELAVDCLLSGDFKRMIQLINSKPYILTARSPFGHKAGLIHYCGSNGVEIWRQVVPSNISQMMDYLIENGADPHQVNNIYYTNSPLRGLIKSSAHPRAAGRLHDMLVILDDYARSSFPK